MARITTRTDFFRVTDEKKYQSIFKRLGGESPIHDLSIEKEGVIYHGFGSYGHISYQCEGKDYPDMEDMTNFFVDLQKILPEKEVFTCFEICNEKFYYIGGNAVVCTKDKIEHLDLATLALDKAREMLNNDTEALTINEAVEKGMSIEVGEKKCSCISISYLDNNNSMYETELTVENNILKDSGKRELINLFNSLKNELNAKEKGILKLRIIASEDTTEELELLGY